MMARAIRSIPVAVGANRLEALRAMAQTRPELKAVVLDDGMQHRALIPDRLVCLQSRPSLTWASVLPAGPWRDLPSRRGAADLVVATQPDVQGEVQSRTLAHPPTCVHPTPGDTPLERPALLVTGTAQPQRVVASAVHLHVVLAACAHYPDHHPYSAQDIEAWNAYGKAHDVQDMVTTAKDAARLDPWLSKMAGWRIWILPVEVAWEDQDAVVRFLNSWVRTLPS
jgi:tetraacyldisaccharide 4'-kinase